MCHWYYPLKLGQRSGLGFYVPFNSQGNIETDVQHCHLIVIEFTQRWHLVISKREMDIDTLLVLIEILFAVGDY